MKRFSIFMYDFKCQHKWWLQDYTFDWIKLANCCLSCKCKGFNCSMWHTNKINVFWNNYHKDQIYLTIVRKELYRPKIFLYTVFCFTLINSLLCFNWHRMFLTYNVSLRLLHFMVMYVVGIVNRIKIQSHFLNWLLHV